MTTANPSAVQLFRLYCSQQNLSKARCTVMCSTQLAYIPALLHVQYSASLGANAQAHSQHTGKCLVVEYLQVKHACQPRIGIGACVGRVGN